MTATTPISLHINQQNFIELSGVEQFSDGSGYRANLAITSWPFSCAEHRFYFQDLAGFTKDLKQVHERVQGKVRLAEMYEKDYIEIEVGKLGHVMVSGSIRQ